MYPEETLAEVLEQDHDAMDQLALLFKHPEFQHEEIKGYIAQSGRGYRRLTKENHK